MNRVALWLHRLEERRRTPTLLQNLSSRSASVSLLLHAACMNKSGCMLARSPSSWQQVRIRLLHAPYWSLEGRPQQVPVEC